MGTFWGSVHVRTTDREAVRRAAEAVATRHRIKWLLAPAIDGWTSLYPNGHGQDERPTHTLAALLPDADLLHVVLHDGDVFAYVFFRQGRLIDEYNSSPEYFGEVPRADHERQRGRPERFADVLGSACSEVERVLHGDAGDAMGQFERFAGLLRLPNAGTSYEYLMDGETDGIARFAEFAAIPDPADERAAKKAQQTAIKARKKELLADGALLAEFAGGKGKMSAPHPCACPIGSSDFLFCWPQYGASEPCEIWRVGPGRWREPSSSGVRLDARLHALAGSPSGRYLVRQRYFVCR